LINSGIIDRKTAFKRIFGNEYEEAEIDEIVRNSKLESGIPLLAQEVPPPQEG
jgi:hypothetical protein